MRGFIHRYLSSQVLEMILLGNGLPFAVTKSRNLRNPKLWMWAFIHRHLSSQVLEMILLGNGLPFAVTKSRKLWNPKLREIHEWEDSFLDLWVAKCQSAPVEALGNVRQTALWSWIVSCKNSLPMDLKYFDWELLSNVRMGLGLFV